MKSLKEYIIQEKLVINKNLVKYTETPENRQKLESIILNEINKCENKILNLNFIDVNKLSDDVFKSLFYNNEINQKINNLNIKTIDISEWKIKGIYDSMFRNLENVEHIIFPDDIVFIKDSAFYECSNLTGSLTIPNSVTSIGNSAFYGCSGFNGTLSIGNSATSIGEYAFESCSGFTGSLSIPNSVTSIGRFAFDCCSGFSGSLTIGNSVISIGDYAFTNCSGFTGSLTIPNSVTEIGNWAFGYCSGFTEVYIPKSVKKIYYGAFEGCKNIKIVHVDDIKSFNDIEFVNKYSNPAWNGAEIKIKK